MCLFKNTPCAIPDINDTICVPCEKAYLILSTATKSKLPGSGEDAYSSKAVMHDGAEHWDGPPVVYELWWKVPAGGVDAIQWERPDLILLTKIHLNLDTVHVYSSLPVIGEETDSAQKAAPRFDPLSRQMLPASIYSYQLVSGSQTITFRDGQGVLRAACAANFIRDGDMPDETGQIPIYTFHWFFPVGKEDQLCAFDWDEADEIVLSQDHVQFLLKPALGLCIDTFYAPTYGETESVNYTAFRWQSSACLIQRKRHESGSDPDEFYVYDLNELVGMPAEAIFSEEGLL